LIDYLGVKEGKRNGRSGEIFGLGFVVCYKIRKKERNMRGKPQAS